MEEENMERTFFENKKIGEVIDQETKIPQRFNEGYDIIEQEIRDIYIR